MPPPPPPRVRSCLASGHLAPFCTLCVTAVSHLGEGVDSGGWDQRAVGHILMQSFPF